MWQIICLCLPAVTGSERQDFLVRSREMLRASGKDPGELDLSLFFLHALSPQESLTVLEERLDLVVRSQELMAAHQLREHDSARNDIVQTLIDDHMRTLLAAEKIWLQRTLAQLQTSYAEAL